MTCRQKGLLKGKLHDVAKSMWYIYFYRNEVFHPTTIEKELRNKEGLIIPDDCRFITACDKKSFEIILICEDFEARLRAEQEREKSIEIYINSIKQD